MCSIPFEFNYHTRRKSNMAMGNLLKIDVSKGKKNIEECSIAMIHYQRLHHLSYPKPISLLHRYGGFLSHGGTPMVYNGKSYWNGLKFGGHPMSYLEPPLATQTSWDFHILPRHLALSRTAGMVWMASKSWSFSTGSLMYCSSNRGW